MDKNIIRIGGALCAGLCLTGLVIVATGRAHGTAVAREQTARADRRAPVLVELFTSEGCSSCPSADQELERLQRTQPFANAVVIPLSEHVDYWNYIGWTDPYSSAAFSERQRGYARAFRLDSVYTPQMVVNGQAEFVGSDRSRAAVAIRQAANGPHASVQLAAENTPNGSARLGVRIENLPLVRSSDAAEVILAVTEDGLRSSVSRGENAGRKLAHTAVVRQMRVLGAATPGQTFAASPTVAIDPRWKANDLSAVVFVQERAGRRVLGAARVSLKPSP